MTTNTHKLEKINKKLQNIKLYRNDDYYISHLSIYARIKIKNKKYANTNESLKKNYKQNRTKSVFSHK